MSKRSKIDVAQNGIPTSTTTEDRRQSHGMRSEASAIKDDRKRRTRKSPILDRTVNVRLPLQSPPSEIELNAIFAVLCNDLSIIFPRSKDHPSR